MNIERIKQLCSISGVSGEEGLVRKLLKEAYEPLADELVFDRLGSIFAIKKSKQAKAKTLMIATALDELGMMISDINKDGTLSFVTLENLSKASILHQRVTITTRDYKQICGVIAVPNHNFMESSCNVEEASLSIDCGLSYEEVKDLVHIGDLVSFKDNFMELSDKLIMSKALQPRLLNEMTIALLEALAPQEFDFNIAIGCIAQSTIGYRGTKTATYVIEPDMAIVLTGFKALNHQGVFTGYYDKQMLPSQRLLKDFTSTIVNTTPHIGMYGNDGSFIHKTLKGTPCLSIGFGINNFGSPNEIVNLDNSQMVIDSLVKYLGQLNNEKLEYFGFGDNYE